MRKIGYLPPIDYKERRTRNRQAIRLGDLESYEGCRDFYVLTEQKVQKPMPSEPTDQHYNIVKANIIKEIYDGQDTFASLFVGAEVFNANQEEPKFYNFLVDTMKPFQTKLTYDYLDWDVWNKGLWGLVLAGRRVLQRIIRTDTFDLFIIATVVANTVTMALQGYVEENDVMNGY